MTPYLLAVDSHSHEAWFSGFCRIVAELAVKGNHIDSLSGILNWCLDGLKAFHKRGLTPTSAIMEATAEYRNDSYKIGRFLAECLEEAGESITAKSAYAVYEEWCRACGYGCENQGNFFAELRTKNLMSKTGTVNRKTKGVEVDLDSILAEETSIIELETTSDEMAVVLPI